MLYNPYSADWLAPISLFYSLFGLLVTSCIFSVTIFVLIHCLLLSSLPLFWVLCSNKEEQHDHIFMCAYSFYFLVTFHITHPTKRGVNDNSRDQAFLAKWLTYSLLQGSSDHLIFSYNQSHILKMTLGSSHINQTRWINSFSKFF